MTSLGEGDAPASPIGGKSLSDIKDGLPGTKDMAGSADNVADSGAGGPHERQIRIHTPIIKRSKTLIEDSPSARTGPPRSLSYMSLPHGLSRIDTNLQGPDSDQGSQFVFASTSGSSNFRGALDFDWKGKRKDTADGNWNELERLHESPKDAKEYFDFSAAAKIIGGEAKENDPLNGKTPVKQRTLSKPVSARTRRSVSAPHLSSDSAKAGAARWGRLRMLLSRLRPPAEAAPSLSAVAGPSVNITDELITGGLSNLMLGLWFERDELGRRRIPVLLHHLRIRVSDSLHALNGHKTLFRIECEYANGATRWVIYRQLRDFVSLHTHYMLSNAFNRNVDKLPQFPRTSLPYFKFLRKETGRSGQKMERMEFARKQREALETYLINLIRAVMFHPSANRLCGFLEISALLIALAQSGGAQYKAGFVRIRAEGNGGAGFGRKSAGWKMRRAIRWCAVRESYLVAVEEFGELAVWDVFLIDSDFKIERPQRYYRQGLNLLNPFSHDEKLGESEHSITQPDNSRTHDLSVMDSIKSRISKIFRRDGVSTQPTDEEKKDHISHPSGHALSVGSSSSLGSLPSRPPTPMLDPSTNTNPFLGADRNITGGEHLNDLNIKDKREEKNAGSSDVSKHIFYIENSQTRLKLVAHNERQMLQWITALEKAAATCPYAGRNRFGSFAPIRFNVSGQWLVDGRDYMWNLSRALLLARESILIHGWWLSPELYLRRPNRAKYRLDHLLERKAKEGIKIYIILYQEVSNRTTPTDSNYTKQKLVSLHPNIMIQRSPSHLQTGTFYWAHHEKLCVIDNTIAFMGGIDLCFGRWDTSQHIMVDDPEYDLEQSKIWPGKDYSNPRVSDFHTLHQPEQDMYDRTKVPRMPWHDVGLQIVGQPARDLARHFIERWNFLLRIKNHSRVMPFLLPPPEFKPAELIQMGLNGTCEMQICRSAGPWSMGTTGRIEHSIQNAYLKAIEISEHFVYIENQFFITSTVVNDIKIENRIGDALVDRIIRAHNQNIPWKCCMVIPVMPGFAFPVDHGDASALRIIMECQNYSISRGPNSLFARLRKEGIDPNDYVAVFALRKWGKLRGGILTTEQIYIHGKTMVVDDRLAIIGSANINERSQRGDRDSEIAAVIRDTDMIEGKMAGRPFKVGRFAHSLRVRLMQEHVGVDVDALPTDDEPMTSDALERDSIRKPLDTNAEQENGRSEGSTSIELKHGSLLGGLTNLETGAIDQGAGNDLAPGTATSLVDKVLPGDADQEVPAGDEASEEEQKADTRTGVKEPRLARTIVPTLEQEKIADGRPQNGVADDKREPYSKAAPDSDTSLSCVPNSDRPEGGCANAEPDAVISQTDRRSARAEATTNRADHEVQKAPQAGSDFRKHFSGRLGDNLTPTSPVKVDHKVFEDPVADEFWFGVWVAAAVHNTEIYRKVFHAIPDDLIRTWRQYREFVEHHERLSKPASGSAMSEPVGQVYDAGVAVAPTQVGTENPSPKGSKPLEKWEGDEMERLLGTLCGNLVLYPHRFLEDEDLANNFLFNTDRLLPMPIYN